MQIVIDISKEEYQTYINHTEAILDKSIPLVHQDLLKAVINGTPLPEHHGRLIDVDALYETSKLCHAEEDGTACIEWREINDAPTIIERSDEE